MADDERVIKLKSNDDEIFTIKYNNVRQSKMISEMLDNALIEDDEEPVPVMKVEGKILEKIIEWLNHHANDPVEEGRDEDELVIRRTDDIDEWDQTFLDIDQGTLFKIILAANFMDIKPLLDVGCKTVANMIKGKTPEELKATFKITNNFTPEEIEEIKNENQWCENSDV